jgi:hypothetical protein
MQTLSQEEIQQVSGGDALSDFIANILASMNQAQKLLDALKGR